VGHNEAGRGAADSDNLDGRRTEPAQQNLLRASEEVKSDPVRARAARAKLVEDTAYQIIDLFTIISGRIELLIDRTPAEHQYELAAIRKVVVNGVRLSDQLLQASRACRLELGVRDMEA